MIVLTLFSWLATLTIIGTYAMSTKYPARFDWANALGFPFIMAAQLLAGVYAPAVLTLFFGVIGIINLIRRKRGDQ